MSEEINKKPNVFPTSEEIAKANSTGSQIANQLNDELIKESVGSYEYKHSSIEEGYAEQMRLKTESQIRLRDEMMRKAHDLADKTDRERAIRDVRGSVMEVRPELAVDYGTKYEVGYGKGNNLETPKVENLEPPKVATLEPPKMDNFKVDEKVDENKLGNGMTNEQLYELLSRPQDDSPYDVIPLPSKGKLYKNGKPTMKVGYLNASDENILTNPNLVQNGKFLEILFNRKMLDTDLRYKDLHTGDRNAIMIWLRSTAYGPTYPISLYDPSDSKSFETTIDLSQLKMIELNVETDNNGHISYVLPLSKDVITFKLLTVGEVDDIETHNDEMELNFGKMYNDMSTFTMKKQITSVNGSYGEAVISKFVDTMLIRDVQTFRKYVNSIECGMDMNLEVRTPGGESLKTFLPLNTSFFWPDLDL